MLLKTKILIYLWLVFIVLIAKTNSVNAENIELSDSSLKVMLQIEDNLSNIAKRLDNTVVSISTQKNKQVTSYFRNYGNEIFNEFFNNFFFGDSSQNEYNQVGLGSGVIISKVGHIITNEHVIAGADKIYVTFTDGRKFEARLIGADYRSDLAVIQINVTNLNFAEMGNSDGLKAGQWAIAMGNPFSFAMENSKPSINLGIISSLGCSLPSTSNRNRAYIDLIQIDAGINLGNSGGPLLNIYGEVIGINVAILSSQGGSSRIGFAVPVNDAKLFFENLIQGEKILLDWVGVEVHDINYVLAEIFELKKTQGVLIKKVLKNSAAADSGLRDNDIILKFNSERVENSLDFMNKIGRLNNQGDSVKLKIVRGSMQRLIKLKLQEKPKELDLNFVKKKLSDNNKQSNMSNNESKETVSKIQLKTWRGMKVTEITKEFADNFEIETDIGVIVTKVIADTPADRAGIQVKDIITQINALNIKTLEDYLFAISKASGKVLIKTNRAYLMIQEL